MATKRKFTIEEARAIGGRLSIHQGNFNFEEFRRGLEVDLEHRQKAPETNVTNDNVPLTGKIAWAHLKEFPDYYTRLDKWETEADESGPHNAKVDAGPGQALSAKSQVVTALRETWLMRHARDGPRASHDITQLTSTNFVSAGAWAGSQQNCGADRLNCLGWPQGVPGHHNEQD